MTTPHLTDDERRDIGSGPRFSSLTAALCAAILARTEPTCLVVLSNQKLLQAAER